MKNHIFLLVISLLVFLVFPIVLAQDETGTEVIGIIQVNTTWTVENSPYYLTGPTAVDSGVTLIIEPGVTVNLNGYYIQVNGTLFAKGNDAEKVYINDGEIRFTVISNDWNESTTTGCIIENAVLNSTNIEIQDTSPLVNNNVFYNSLVWCIRQGSNAVSNSTFVKSTIAVMEANVTISGNTIVDSLQAIWIRPGLFEIQSFPVIERNLIFGNEEGIAITNWSDDMLHSPIIRNNTIANNTCGISFELVMGAGVSPLINNNNFINNSEYNIDLSSNAHNDINATYNWWGTTDTQTINQSIYDFKNDFTLGTVNFVPFLTEPNPNAPSIPTDIIPEFTSWVILTILLAVSLLGLIVRKKSNVP